MDISRIAARVANRRYGYSAILLEKVTDEMKRAMDVDESAKPFESGANSVVYENDKGNIVSFSDWDKLYEIGKKAMDKGASTLPEIGRVEEFEMAEEEEAGYFSSGPAKMYAVEMEKLNMLSGDDQRVWNKYKDDIFHGDGPKSVDPEDKEFVQGMLDLKEKSAKEGVTQEDPDSGNVAKDNHGDFKWIDLELIRIS